MADLVPTAENDRTRWACNACSWTHSAHPVYGWSERDERAVEVHQTMLCPDAITADCHACVGGDCPGCAAALARPIPPVEPVWIDCTCGHPNDDHDVYGCSPACGCTDPGLAPTRPIPPGAGDPVA